MYQFCPKYLEYSECTCYRGDDSSIISLFSLNMEAAQLSREVPISDTRRYWIGRRTRLNDQCEYQSLLCYGQNMLRKDILDRLWKWTEQENLECGAVRLFGGLVRREITAQRHIGSMFDETPPEFMSAAFQNNRGVRGSPFHVSEKCFVSEGTDMDLFFEEVGDVAKFRNMLNRAYRVFPSVRQTSYNGCRVWHLEISQTLQIFGPRIVVRLDLVTRAAPEVVLLPDFSVNQLQVDQEGTLGLFMVPSYQTESPLGETIQRAKRVARTVDMIEARQTDLLMYSWDYYQHMMVNHCRVLDDVYPPSSESPIHSVSLDDSWDPYVAQSTDPGTREYYARYINRLIRHRLSKMLHDKWTITNVSAVYHTTRSLQMSCGHQWHFCSGDLQVQDESGARIRCPVCRSVDTVAESFVA